MKAFFAPVVLLALIAGGCHSATGPGPEPAVVLDLQVVEEGDGSRTAYATVQNTGRVAVRFEDCCGFGVYLGVHDSTGEAVRLSCDPLPMCPCGPAVLEPGQTKRAGLIFRGVACGFEGPDDFEQLPPGEYRFVAGFSYTWTDEVGAEQVTDLETDFAFTK